MKSTESLEDSVNIIVKGMVPFTFLTEHWKVFNKWPYNHLPTHFTSTPPTYFTSTHNTSDYVPKTEAIRS